MDGMDQSKLLLPTLLNQAKTYASAWRLKTHLTGSSLLVYIFYKYFFWYSLYVIVTYMKMNA